LSAEEVRELLLATHAFPGSYTMKVIGAAGDDFVGRVVLAAQHSLTRPADVLHRTRSTPNGEHVSVTLVMHVETPEEIITVYESLQRVQGLKVLM
jgi:hypothetical protein